MPFQKGHKINVGRKCPKSAEHRKKISEARRGKCLGNQFSKGKIPWNKGIKNCYSEKILQKMSNSHKGKNLGNQYGFKKGQTVWNKGKPWSKEIRDKVSQTKMGSIPWNKGKRGSQIAWNKGIKMPQFSGINHPQWQGGITSTHQKLRNSFEMKEWRKHVFARDNYVCQACGQKASGNLVADHELPFALYPDLRFEVLNGRTLCEPCHHKIPTNNNAWKLPELTFA